MTHDTFEKSQVYEEEKLTIYYRQNYKLISDIRSKV